MIEAMKSEGKRASVHFWQRIGLLNDIAIIAPMIGLLGTVLGMFYAFYDINRSIESISTLFDGLGGRAQRFSVTEDNGLSRISG